MENNAPRRILLCEDDANLGTLLREYLEAKGYDTTLCADGEAGLTTFNGGHFDLCILDVMMPKMDGFTLAKQIRAAVPEQSFIFLTAKTLKDDVLEGFRLGADDYLTKPFSMEELVFRVEAILRRTAGRPRHPQNIFRLGRITFDAQKQILTYASGEERRVTTREKELLLLLCRHRGEVLQRDYALRTIWVDDNYFNARSMDVYITKLRKLLRDEPEVEIINVHGRGYKLLAPDPDDE